MCGRYAVITKVKAIEKRFNLNDSSQEFAANANVATGDFAPVVTSDNPKELQLFQFGFTPKWASKKMYVINARSEGDKNKDNDRNYTGSMGIINKPMFREAIRKKRCLVIADGFFEGPQKEKLNKPYFFYPTKGKKTFAFAGIWDEWIDETSGEISGSFAIITTVSNKATHAIGHHRSPVILDESDEKLWLNEDAELGEVLNLLKPAADDLLNAYPVDKEVKSIKNKDLWLLEPKGQRIFPEFDYEIFQELQLEGMGSTTARKRKNNEPKQGSLF